MREGVAAPQGGVVAAVCCCRCKWSSTRRLHSVGVPQSVSHTSNNVAMDDSRWTRDLPVLDVTVQLLEDHDMPEVIDIAGRTGFDTRKQRYA